MKREQGAGDPEKVAESMRWERLIARLRREAEGMGGFGELVVQLAFYEGAPQSVDLVQRRPRYRLDR